MALSRNSLFQVIAPFPLQCNVWTRDPLPPLIRGIDFPHKSPQPLTYPGYPTLFFPPCRVESILLHLYQERVSFLITDPQVPLLAPRNLSEISHPVPILLRINPNLHVIGTRFRDPFEVLASLFCFFLSVFSLRSPSPQCSPPAIQRVPFFSSPLLKEKILFTDCRTTIGTPRFFHGPCFSRAPFNPRL